jgi:hypothetical protein
MLDAHKLYCDRHRGRESAVNERKLRVEERNACRYKITGNIRQGLQWSVFISHCLDPLNCKNS